MLGLIGRAKRLVPQQMWLADVVNAGCQIVGVLMPRRSTKTTSIIALMLGRCAERPDYVVGYTMCTTGMKARARFRQDVANVLDRMFPDEDSRPFKIRRAAGSERVDFDNGSSFQVLVPAGDAFRGDAFDVVVLDEAGEASPEMTEDLMAGILPTFDTRPGAQLVVAGTAAKYREGNLLWETLADGRKGLQSTGILEYAAPDDTDMELLDDWEHVKALVLAAHPGVGNLTTLEVVRARWEKLSRRQFAEEYLSIFGTLGAVDTFVDLEKWRDAADGGELPSPPTDRAVGLAVAVHPDQSCATIVAAWRDDSGAGCLLVVDYKSGTKWVAKRAKELSAKLRTSIIYDNAGTVLVEVEVMQRMKPRPRLAPQTWAQVSTAAGLIMKENGDGNLRHWDQVELNEAVKTATKRGTPTSNRWAFGRKLPGESIIALEAASLALRWADENPKRARTRAMVA